MPARWELFDHEADIGVRGRGPTFKAAFEQAGLALTAVSTDPGLVKPEQCITIECEAPCEDTLLLDWLNALIYEMSTKNMVFGKYDVSIVNLRLRAKAWGEKVDIKRHAPAVEVKAATFAELKVTRVKKEWIAQCIVDV